MSEDAPVAVVIPTHNRVALLRRLTDALAGQQGVEFDVVVVDDGSTDATPAELRQLASDDRLRIVPMRLDPNGGPARARNAGWRATSADVVVFTDDDCVPQPGWLTALVKGVDDADVAIGQTLPNPDQRGQGGPFPHFVRVTRDRGTYQTCNIAYRRQVLEQVGGFSEDFRHAYAEDADLGWSARESGAHIAFEPAALVYHDVWRWSFRKYVGHGRALEDVVLLAKRHPAIRDTYPR